MIFRNISIFGIPLFLLLCSQINLALALSIDKSPRPAFLLPKSGAFLILQAFDRAALHNIKDGNLIRTISCEARFGCMDVSQEEKFLAAACSNHSIGVWDLEKGTKLWGFATCNTFDISFSWDGKSVVACDDCGMVYVLETKTGKKIANFHMPGTSIMSAALTPDGSKGVFLDLAGNWFKFDVISGKKEKLSINGSSPVRCSSDGNFMAFSDWADNTGQLVVVGLQPGEKPKSYSVGKIGRIKPAADGSFLVTTSSRLYGPMAGIRYHPATGKVEEVWKLDSGSMMEEMDFDPETKLGISTTYNLKSWLIDLGTGKTLISIDNSENYRLHSARRWSWHSVEKFITLLSPFGLLLAFWLLMRSLSKKKPSPN